MVDNQTSESVNNLLKEHSDLAGCLMLCTSALQNYLKINEVEGTPPPQILVTAYRQALETLAMYDFIELDNWKKF